MGAGSWSLGVGCGHVCFSEDQGALWRWELGKGPGDPSPPLTALASRWDSRSVGSLSRSAKPGTPAYCWCMKARSTLGSEPHVQAKRVGSLSWAGRDPSHGPCSSPSCNPQICRQGRETQDYQEDWGTKLLPSRGPISSIPCTALARSWHSCSANQTL